MLDKILFWLVLSIPIALGLIVLLVPPTRVNWRYAVGICLIAYAGISCWQQMRMVEVRQTAVENAADRVATGVRLSVAQGYEALISSEESKIVQLQNELAARRK